MSVKRVERVKVEVRAPGAEEDDWSEYSIAPAPDVEAWLQHPRDALGREFPAGTYLRVLRWADYLDDDDGGEWMVDDVYGAMLILPEWVQEYLDPRCQDRARASREVKALVGLVKIYVEHELWHPDGSSGVDDAAALYALMGRLGLEVA